MCCVVCYAEDEDNSPSAAAPGPGECIKLRWTSSCSSDPCRVLRRRLFVSMLHGHLVCLPHLHALAAAFVQRCWSMLPSKFYDTLCLLDS
jgi:hypothetical protein